jgi:transketolase
MNSVSDSQAFARQIRAEAVQMVARAKASHIGGALSMADLLAVLYGEILCVRSDEPRWPERDRFILSKGHAAPALYAVLARAGFFPLSELSQFRTIDSPLHGHPKQNVSIGVEVTSGSLGQGLSFGLGAALAARLAHRAYHVYVLLGDGECDEGQVWEAAMAAAHYKADNLTAIVDYNKYQQTGPIAREMALEPFADKWKAFGWHVEEAEGHNMEDLRKHLGCARRIQGRPQVVIAHTTKGKGVSFMESDYTFHARSPSGEQLQQAREEILRAHR